MNEIKLDDFAYNSSHMLIDSCDNIPEIIHITLFSHSKKMLFLEYNMNTQVYFNQKTIDCELYSSELIKKIEYKCQSTIFK